MNTGRRLCCFAMLGFAALCGAPDVVRAQSATPDSGCVAAAGPDRAPSPTATPTSPTPPRDSSRTAASDDAPDVRILASVSADEVTFARQPKICVRLRGDARLDSVRVVGRRNLTSPVVSGTTYRNVFVAVEILGHIDASCIASRITGERADTTSTKRACASLEVKTSP